MTDHRPAGEFDLERREHSGSRPRADWIADAEEEWRRLTGRSMTAEELERRLRRYPDGL